MSFSKQTYCDSWSKRAEERQHVGTFTGIAGSTLNSLPPMPTSAPSP